MVGRLVGIASLVLSASAFLVPANLVELPSPAKAIEVNVAKLNAKSLSLKLPCSECAFSYNQEEKIEDADEDNWFSIQGGANSVVVTFTVSEDGQRLEANGEPIYPIGLAVADMFRSPHHYVKQVAQSATLEEMKTGEAKSANLEVTGHGVSIMSEESVSEQGDKVIPIKYTIFELEGKPVSLDEVTLQLLDTKEHGLLIINSEINARPTPRPDDSFGHPHKHMEGLQHEVIATPIGQHKECKNLPAPICKLRNIIEDKIAGMQHGMRKGHGKGKGCHGRMGKFGKHHGPPHGHLPGHTKPHFQMDGEESAPHHGRPHHRRPHGHHGHHHHHKGFYHAFSRGLSAVLVPTMAGIAVGMTVSLIGLIVGRLIGFVWIKFYRGGRRGYASVTLDDNAVVRAESKKEFEVESARSSLESAPPVYENAPAYEAVEKDDH